MTRHPAGPFVAAAALLCALLCGSAGAQRPLLDLEGSLLPPPAAIADSALIQLPVAAIDEEESAPIDEAEVEDEDLWARIRAGFAMDDIDSSLVQRHEAWYLNRPDYVQRMIDRSRRYLFHIVEEVEKRGMPTEIALLPMIESAFNPVANSHMRAVGIWQFIPSTGRKYGLKQNWWYDGRRDVLAATRAALDYLEFLHATFDDWELALAAYNCGEGAVQRAISRNRAGGKRTEYAHIKLPRETRNYLPKLQAVKNIISNPSLVGIDLEPLPNRPYFVVVNAPDHIDMEMAAKLADVPLEEFQYLNPGHRRPVITPVANRQLLVPADKADLFTANLESNAEPLVSWQTYTLKPNEKLDAVAQKFGIGVARLKEINGLSSRKRVRPGQLLLVPMADDSVESNLDETYNSQEFQAPVEDYRRRVVYRVKQGDTLHKIARHYGVTVARVKDWNRLRGSQLQVGQKLTLWKDANVRTVKRRVAVR